MKTFKFLHRWLGVLAALFILMFALSGIVLNHRSFFSGIDINRKYLPKNYRYNNWNLAAVKSATEIGTDSILFYGNIGIWLTDSTFSGFEPFNEGIKPGSDNRRTASIIKTTDGKILAGTMSGLYFLDNNTWKIITLPVKETRITAITETPDGLWILTRSHLMKARKTDSAIEPIEVALPHPAGFKAETTLFRALWVIHSGKILGTPGKLLVDVMGVFMIFLSLTGIVWFMAPDMMKALKKKPTLKKRVAKVNRFSLKWHNHIGIWSVVFLIILTITGMFLRPPLLIAIVNSKFPALKHTIIDHPNPWYDKLRDIQYDRLADAFIISTSDGFFAATPGFSDSLFRIPTQPPISVMGINVFEQPEDGVFITGSFSGIHTWIPSQHFIQDRITGMYVIPGTGMAHPFGSVPVAGYFNPGNGSEYIFDYNAGVFSTSRNLPNLPMPEPVSAHSPMPLWNLALEIHTGRFYSVIFGKYYILFIPLAGLVILTILVSGGVIWIKNYRRKCRNANLKTKLP